MKRKIFRWRAIGPLLLLLLILFILWLIFGDMLVEDTGEEVSTKALGTQVDISGLHVRETESRVEIGSLQVADPFNLSRNLLESGTIALDLDPAALLEKKLVVEQLRIQDLRFGTERRTPASPVTGGGLAPTLLRQVRQWAAQFDVPLLQLTPIDTVKALVLDPTQLSTVKEAEAVVARADSLRLAFIEQVKALDPRPVIDSARALADRLAGATPARLGIAGTREAVQSVRRTIQEIDRTRERIKALEANGEQGIQLLQQGVRAVDQARQRDYAFARSLLQLPSFDAPDIGSALFGRVSVDRFEKALYWAELAQSYLPPGLRPRVRPSPKRLRADGITVGFPREKDYPAFLLEDGAIDVSFDAFGGSHAIAAVVKGVTTEPALYGRPATVSAEGSIGGSHPMSINVGALIDHRGEMPHDSARLRLHGVPLPSFDLPGLPFRLEPGAGSSQLQFSMRGKQIAGRWTLSSSNPAWVRDSTSKSGMLEDLIWRVVSGLQELEVTAEVGGTVQSPTFRVHSNLDEAIANRVKALLGEELQAAEARVRAQVDQLVADKVAELKARQAAVTDEIRSNVATLNDQLNAARAALEARLKTLTGGLGGVLGM